MPRDYDVCEWCSVGKPTCGVTTQDPEDSEEELKCTRPYGHIGEHAACGLSSGEHLHPIHTWRDDDA